MSGRDPSSPLLANADLQSERGTARDAIGAINNLRQLVRSTRVGPKALSRIIPDVHASCAPLRATLRRLVEHAPDFVMPECKEPLGAYVVPRIEELERALFGARRGSFKASQRLHLEAVVTRTAIALNATLALLELLHDVGTSPPVAVDVLELVRESTSFFDAAMPGGRRVPLSVRHPARIPTLSASPRVAMALVVMSAGLAATGPRTEGVTLAIEGESRSRCRLVFGLGPTDASSAEVVVPPLIPATEACCTSAAAAVGGALHRLEDRVVLELPRLGTRSVP